MQRIPKRLPPLSPKQYRETFPDEYSSWKNMRIRVRNGYATCSEELWDFKGFLEILGPMKETGLSLDRIDFERGYEQGNVKWATKTEQSNNRRNTIFLTYQGTKFPAWSGQRLPLTEWARLTDQNAITLRQRRFKKWSDTEVIDGERLKATKTFAQMSEGDLINFKPWPDETSQEDEALYVRQRKKGESRFAFERRVLIPRWQRKIDQSAPATMIRASEIPDTERDFWEDESSLQSGGWVMRREGDERDLARIASRQNKLRKYIKENLAEEKFWLAALRRHRTTRLGSKAAEDLKRTHLTAAVRPADTQRDFDLEDPMSDWEFSDGSK